MENQQERLRDIGWLCGIIDGEGTITLRFHRNKNRPPLIVPSITVVNTDEKIINKIVEILKAHEIPFWVTSVDATTKWKKRYVVSIIGIKRTLKLLPILVENLVGKREQAEIMLEWCNNRLGKKSYYTEWDYEMIERIKLLHSHQDKVEKSLKILRDYMPNTEM